MSNGCSLKKSGFENFWEKAQNTKNLASPEGVKQIKDKINKSNPDGEHKGCLKDIDKELDEQQQQEEKAAQGDDGIDPNAENEEDEELDENGKPKTEYKCFLAKYKQVVKNIKWLCLSVKRCINEAMDLLNVLANIGEKAR